MEKRRKKKSEEKGKRKKAERGKRKKEKGRKKKTPCMGYRHPVLGKFFKMVEFQGFNMLTLRIGPFESMKKIFHFMQKIILETK